MRSCLEHAQERAAEDLEKTDDVAPYRVFPKKENVLTSLRLTELFVPCTSYAV